MQNSLVRYPKNSCKNKKKLLKLFQHFKTNFKMKMKDFQRPLLHVLKTLFNTWMRKQQCQVLDMASISCMHKWCIINNYFKSSKVHWLSNFRERWSHYLHEGKSLFPHFCYIFKKVILLYNKNVCWFPSLPLLN